MKEFIVPCFVFVLSKKWVITLLYIQSDVFLRTENVIRSVWRVLPRSVFKDEQSQPLTWPRSQLYSAKIGSYYFKWKAEQLSGTASLLLFSPCYVSQLICFVCSNWRVWNVIQLHETIVALRGRAQRSDGTWSTRSCAVQGSHVLKLQKRQMSKVIFFPPKFWSVGVKAGPAAAAPSLLVRFLTQLP